MMDRVKQTQLKREGRRVEIPMYDCLKTNPELRQKARIGVMSWYGCLKSFEKQERWNHDISSLNICLRTRFLFKVWGYTDRGIGTHL